MIGMIGGLLWGTLWTLQTFVHGPAKAGLGSAVYGPFLFLPWFLFVFSWLGVYIRGRYRFSLLRWMGYGVTLFALSLGGIGLFLVGVLGIEAAYITVFVTGHLGSRIVSAGSQFGCEISGYGTLFLIVGFLLLGIAGIRSPLPVRWRVLAFVTGLIYKSVLLFYFAGLMVVHAIVYGLTWMVFGYFLRKDSPALLIRSD